jgi:hypothetical protein
MTHRKKSLSMPDKDFGCDRTLAIQLLIGPSPMPVR